MRERAKGSKSSRKKAPKTRKGLEKISGLTVHSKGSRIVKARRTKATMFRQVPLTKTESLSSGRSGQTKSSKELGVRKRSEASGVTEREPEVLDKTEQQDLSAKKKDRARSSP